MTSCLKLTNKQTKKQVHDTHIGHYTIHNWASLECKVQHSRYVFEAQFSKSISTPLNWGRSISDFKIRHWPLVTKMFCRDVRASSCSVNTAVIFEAIYWRVPHSYGLKHKSLWHKRSPAAPQMCNFFFLFFLSRSFLRPVVTGETSDIFLWQTQR